MKPDHIRNVGIIAHVDHGKTTLIDRLLEQSGAFRDNQAHPDCVMDSNDLERERGITILSKNATIHYKGFKINIVDTPGHADFGGEVERVLNMVNGVVLLVDAAEGPMPQTRFVLKKSLELGLKPILVVNKIDRTGADPERAINLVFDLMVNLGASDDQLDFPILYTSAKLGQSRHNLEDEPGDMTQVLDTIIEKIVPQEVNEEDRFRMLVTSIDYNDYLGRIAVGKVERGNFNIKDPLVRIKTNGEIESFKTAKAFTYSGMQRVELSETCSGDIIAIAGMKEINIGETIACSKQPDALPPIEVDEPTMAIHFIVNDSPFAGKEGKFLTQNHIRSRLEREAKSNVAMLVEETDRRDTFKVSGRGELHLSILIETMRREGYEFAVSRPQVLFKEIDGVKLEPDETVVIDVEDTYSGKVMEALGGRKGRLQNMTPMGDGHTRLEYEITTRCLFGFQSEFLTLTKGTGTLQHSFNKYIPVVEHSGGRRNGVLIAMDAGATTGYSINSLQDRGVLFLHPGEEVYTGMIVGENKKDNDLVVNITREKKLTNVRASGSDDHVSLTPPRRMSLEQVLEFLNADELAEITPTQIRIRKRLLDENDRKRAAKKLQAG
ncbi:MAG: translational GTPase TypA [Candidatus Nitronauta litoralis]|uniref:Large ribosomal subunit assembly factor BipA n=1 Tax=Candidatus Nitronauta litoralis TaxID=2705533 RepID=A0A7T0BYK5_9BACT|nr:MAG: translational GTPase TypA [Candidatus Nitronauta litoralis]